MEEVKVMTRGQPRPGWAPDPPMVGIRSPIGLVVGSAPATLEFWVRFPNERNQGKQAHPVFKYRVPHGSHTGLGSSSLIALSSPPHANSFVIGPAVIKHTRGQLGFRVNTERLAEREKLLYRLGSELNRTV